MKKLCTIILCLIWSFPVCAESAYSAFEDTPCTLYENGELAKFTVTRKYQWYKNNNSGKYFLEGTNPNDYNIKDKFDTKWTTYSDWDFGFPEAKQGREIETRYIYKYQTYKPIQYFFLSGFKGGNGKLYIPEIIVYDNDKKVDFEVTCTGCSDGFETYVKNGDYKEADSYVTSESILKIRLLGQKKYTNLGFQLFLYDTSNEAKGYKVAATHEDDIEDVYYRLTNIHHFQSDSLEGVTMVPLYIHSMQKMNPKWDTPQISLDKVESSKDCLVNITAQYRYRDTFYKFYKVTRQYNQIYTEGPSSTYTIKDQERYKDFYHCQKRDKRNLSHMVEFFTENYLPNKGNSFSKTIPYKVDRVYYKNIRNNEQKRLSENSPVSCPKDTSTEKYKSCKQDKQIIFYVLFLLCLVLLAERIYQKYKKEK